MLLKENVVFMMKAIIKPLMVEEKVNENNLQLTNVVVIF